MLGCSGVYGKGVVHGLSKSEVGQKLSLAPLVMSGLVGLSVVMIFEWYVGFRFLMIFSLLVLVALRIYSEVHVSLEVSHRALAFWIFLFGEAGLFGALFWVLFWCVDGNGGLVSPPNEIPFVGCILLLSSSFSLVGYHHSYGLSSSRLHLLLSILYGAGFLMLQAWEMYNCECDAWFSSDLGGSFCLISLHFLHVVAGVTAMSWLFFRCGALGVSHYHVGTLVVWYWHFVDYVWLLVYLLVYFK